MSLLTNLLIGRSGMSAAQAGLDATAQNVANSTVDGATRRTIATSVATPLRDGRHWIGQGASVDAVQRPSNRFLETRRIAALGDASRTELAWQSLRTVERVFDGSQVNTSKDTLDAFFDSLTRATSDPGDPSLRRGVVRAAQDLSRAISRDAQTFDEALSDGASDLAAALPEVNQRLAEVAELNRQIQTSSGGLGTGDLQDRRASLLQELGQLAGIQVEIDAGGVASVYVDGHAAVSGQNARSLSATVDEDTGRPQVMLSHSQDQRIDVTAGIGGALGGRMDAWDTVRARLDELNTFASDLASTLNAQHRAGFDRSGAAGGDLFVVDATAPALSLSVADAIVEDASALAFGGETPTLAGDIDNLRILIGMEQDPLIGGTTSASDWLTAITSELGTEISQLETRAQSQSLIARDLEELHQNLHGIDLDEEATNLLLYQTAYQAAARVIAANDTLMDSLLELV